MIGGEDMLIAEQKQRNSEAREGIERVYREYGIRWDFIRDTLKISPSTFSHWKSSRFDFGKDRLMVVESLIVKYENMK